MCSSLFIGAQERAGIFARTIIPPRARLGPSVPRRVLQEELVVVDDESEMRYRKVGDGG